ncbi:ethanolamine ammonia-lyase subunit EutC [Provencibacterium massiliense]|uniref:ethanolamine ammonia-lyase subunit EutC n=1 Tax=Provencibacterium massiliense TaxID=1841868 RepID=UPI001FA92E8C|nr:ethanolamine ammonia-lyase subunit EutC [Provencibacterium massiliense]
MEDILEMITRAVMKELENLPPSGAAQVAAPPVEGPSQAAPPAQEALRDLSGGALVDLTSDAMVDLTSAAMVDLTSAAHKAVPTLQNPQNPEALAGMKRRTPARIGVGKAGPRLRTDTMLTLRADHAVARDAVFRDVDPALLGELGLFSVQTLCQDRNEHLTRPDLGRRFSPETTNELKAKCRQAPQVQIYLSDGLSSQAVDANARDILPSLLDALRDYGITAGTPFFVRFGRVPAMDAVSEALGAEVTCVLIGERPGLATADSMSAYIAYKATVGMPEARRTVVSNIHKGGIPAVEAGAHIAGLIKTMLERKKSGVELQL